MTELFEQVAAYKQAHPELEEILQVADEVLLVYEEANRIYQQALVSMQRVRIVIDSKTMQL